MTFAEFRSDSSRVAKLRQILELPEMREALAVLIENGPEKNIVPMDVTPHGAHILLGHSRGYAEYHTNLTMLTTHPSPPKQIPATYDPAEE